MRIGRNELGLMDLFFCMEAKSTQNAVNGVHHVQNDLLVLNQHSILSTNELQARVSKDREKATHFQS